VDLGSEHRFRKGITRRVKSHPCKQEAGEDGAITGASRDITGRSIRVGLVV